MRTRCHRLIACTLLMGALAACGFHLRRAPEFPQQMRAIYLSGGAVTSSATSGGSEISSVILMRNLRRDLATDNTQVVDDPTLATALLKIISVKQGSSLLAISNTGQPLEYKVYYQVEFSLQVGNTMLIEPQDLILTRTYNYSVTDAIGNEEQEQGLSSAMAKDMARLIVFRIQAAAKSATQAPVTVAAPIKATVPPPAATTQPSTH